tara:strand:+ start:13803 stop:15275 length:1473 start_codon:yes stop_codon:yes gene_type:complete
MYTWIVVTGGVFAFIAAMGIGANDVANAYATSVGSKALTIKQAVLCATVFETSGAILMGSHVTNTIRKGIADYECFEDDPGALMYGCMWVCFCVGVWLFIASKYEMPVSTTHSCVGGMIGMTIALKGTQCVIWYEPRDMFPYIGGVSGIIISWILSPVFSGIISSTLFGVMRKFILRSDQSFNRTTYLFPLLIGTTVTLNTFFIIYKGAKGLGLDETPMSQATIISFGVGGVTAIIIYPFTRYIRDTVVKRINQEEKSIDLHKSELGVLIEEAYTPNCCDIVGHINNNLKVNINDIISNDNTVNDIHYNAEKFDEATEEYFKSLQIFTAMCDSFSHGANDVANAIGPFAAIYMIGRDAHVNNKNELGNDAYWILALGGVGISFGLLIYGYKIMQTIGLKLCKITPSRGVAIELSSALVIITGSRLEIPLSTTHCQIGATIGVAALEDPHKCSGINGKILIRTIVGWILTLVVVGTSCGILTAQGVYAPEI